MSFRDLMSCNISNMRASVSSRYPNTETENNYDVQQSISDKIQGVWIADETCTVLCV